jgi:hypothetical protein
MSGDGAGGMAGGGGVRGVSGPVRGPDAPGGLYGEGEECTENYGGTEGIGGPSGNCQGQAGGVGQYPGESEAERKARLEKTLEESVGGFDEVLAEEQREISTVGRNTEGFGGSGGAGSGRVGLGKQATGGGEGAEGSGGGAGGGSGSVVEPGEQREATVGGLTEEEIKARTPDDIPDLVSEDIVAKQLREAALSEEDPVLRERLWEEYRLYNDL